MRDFSDKTAVITGAASGIGRAIARRCAARGMKIVLADIEGGALAATELELRGLGAAVATAQTDVSRCADVERVAELALDRFGAVHLLFNNAGVGLVGPRIWECTTADWRWLLEVNLCGIVHALNVFVPIMLGQATECHIVNTASAAGLAPPPGMGAYSVSKAGVVVLSETLQHELALCGAPIKVSVICPGLVRTRMVESARNRPEALQNAPRLESERRLEHDSDVQQLRRATGAAMSPDHVAGLVLTAIRDERFFVFTHPRLLRTLERRLENTRRGRDPWVGTGSESDENESV